MWIAINKLNRVSIHQEEPSYNELYDSWRGGIKIDAPNNLLKLFADEEHVPICMCIDHISEDKSVLISKKLKIFFNEI